MPTMRRLARLGVKYIRMIELITRNNSNVDSHENRVSPSQWAELDENQACIENEIID